MTDAGTFTRLALDLEKCEAYAPEVWDRVYKRSQSRLRVYESKKTTRKRPRPGRAPSTKSLKSYLDQPELVHQLLNGPVPDQQRTLTPSSVPRTSKRESFTLVLQEESPAKLPILKILTPRTRQWISRMPKPKEDEWSAINQLQAFADDAIQRKVHSIDRLTNRHNLYGNIQRGTSPTKPLIKHRRPRIIAAPKEVVERQRMAQEDVNVAPQSLFHSSPIDEKKLMIQEDVNVHCIFERNDMLLNDVNISDYLIASVAACSQEETRQHFIALNKSHQVWLNAALKQDHRHSAASDSLHDALADVKKWLPLDVIYKHGKGPYASMHIHKAMDMVQKSLLRLRNLVLVEAFSKWHCINQELRQLERDQAVILLQCWWRQILARQELNIRRELRRQQIERELKLLAWISTKKNHAAKVITKHMRAFSKACQTKRELARIKAAIRIQRFQRHRRALWNQFLQMLRRQRQVKAAIALQTWTRGVLAKRALVLARKLYAVELKRLYAQAVATEKARQLQVIGAVLLVQRNFRRRVHAHKEKFAVMRRRHAKKVAAAVRVQAWWRMQLAKKLGHHLRSVMSPAAQAIQLAWRRYHSRMQLKQLRLEKQIAIRTRKQAKKDYRRQQRQLHKQRSHAKGLTKVLIQVQDQVQSVQKVIREPSVEQREKAACRLQAGWRGYKTRRRVGKLHAQTAESTRRRELRRRKNAAVAIQRIVRGVLGRKRWWEFKINTSVIAIQRLFRSRIARQAVLDLQRYIKAAVLIKKCWIKKKSFVEYRRQRRAVVKIQALARMFLQVKAFQSFVQMRQRRLELQAIGAVLLSQTMSYVQKTLLLWSYQFPYVPGKDQPNGNVQRPLLKRDSPSQCFGIWQLLFLAICRYGNSPDATELDNMRFSKFMKEIPGALHKTLCPLQTIDVAFAKGKVGKSRTISFMAFHKVMESILTLRFPDLPSPEARYLQFMQKHVLVSNYGEPFRLQLSQLALERASWAAHTIQTMLRHALQRERHREFLIRFRALCERKTKGKAALIIQSWWRQLKTRFQFDKLLRESYVEYINWKSGAKSYKNLITGTITYCKPTLLRDMTPFVSIQSPPPDEEYIVYCGKHDTQPIEKATKYCLECDDAVCDWCHERDHKRAPFSKHRIIPIELCSLCSVQTATRSCNQCKEGNAPYCDSCYPHYHKDKKHTFTPLVALCVECQVKVGCWKCHVCTDFFCKKCFSSFHRKGHRQHHTLERVAYLPIQAKEMQDQQAREQQRRQQALLVEAQVHQQLQHIDESKMELAAKMIQSAYRAMKERVAGKAYMKMIRQTNWIMQQRVKDDVIRKGMAYKFKKAIGVAQALASDTADEAAAIAARKEAIKDALGLSTYDYTKGPPAWCIYNATVLIVRGEYKNCQARVVSTKTLIESGNILVFINDAHKSITLSIRDVRPFDEEQEAAGALGRLGQTLTKATHKIQSSMISKVEQKRLELKLLHHRTEFKDIEEYAWIPSRDQDSGVENWWNVVSNGKAATKPRTLAALDTMQPTAKDEIMTQINEAHERLIKILRKTDRGAVDRRASFDIISAPPEQLNSINDAIFYFDNLWSHPHVGTKAKELTKDLSTTQLQSVVRLFARLKGNLADDEWEDFVVKFCRLPQNDKHEFTERCEDMTIEEAIASLANISQSEKAQNSRAKHQSIDENHED